MIKGTYSTLHCYTWYYQVLEKESLQHIIIIIVGSNPLVVGNLAFIPVFNVQQESVNIFALFALDQLANWNFCECLIFHFKAFRATSDPLASFPSNQLQVEGLLVRPFHNKFALCLPCICFNLWSFFTTLSYASLLGCSRRRMDPDPIVSTA